MKPITPVNDTSEEIDLKAIEVSLPLQYFELILENGKISSTRSTCPGPPGRTGPTCDIHLTRPHTVK